MSELSVATFNIHAGIDGWGRPFDVVAACASLDADILALEENWAPDGGASIAAQVAASLGYHFYEVGLARALISVRQDASGTSWGPNTATRSWPRALCVGVSADAARSQLAPGRLDALSGTWGIAVLSRAALRGAKTIELGRLRRDKADRRALVLAQVESGSSTLTVGVTHLAHFLQGSPLLLNKLHAALPDRHQPAVLAGDMNFWGPPLSLAMPGWKRAARGRTYPAWRPHSQVDHIFVTPPVTVLTGGSLEVGNSDHRPVRAQIAF
jgi:endonuclease/exonuclease/phosphatase family metal-dependent hydrolase